MSSESWPLNCQSCPHFGLGKRFIDFNGLGSNGILLVGESGWKDEAREGKPFVGAAGSYLNKLLKWAGTVREDYLVSNAMWCLPPALGWFQSSAAWEAINHCRPNLDKLIEENKPRVIVTLGDTAMRRVLGVEGIFSHHSYIHDSPYGIPVIPTFHPSFLMQGNHKLSSAVIFALRRALQLAGNNGKYDRLPISYVLDEPLPSCESYFAEWTPDMPLAVDIENPIKDKLSDDEEDEMEGVKEDISFAITRIGFSYRAGTGISMPWVEPFISFALSIINQARCQLYWNRNHDIPRLVYHGARPKGDVIDVMYQWHYLQSDVPKKLGFVAPFYYDGPAWKHLSSSEPALYNCLLGDTRVVLFSGETRKLEDVVKKREALTLRGEDEHGRPIPVKIIGWHKTHVAHQKWLRIKTEATRQPIYATPDHRVWTKEGWTRAEDIKVGDFVKSPHFGSDDLIHGCLLGDGSVDRRGRFTFTHCEKQLEYLKAKAGHLGKTKLSQYSSTVRTIGGITANCSPSYRVEVGVSVTRWRKRFYDAEGKKQFIAPPSDAALAIWYCDDGTWARNSDNYIGNPRFATLGFGNFVDCLHWFQSEFGKTNVKVYNFSRRLGGVISLIGGGPKQFFERVAPYVHPNMQYKLPIEYRGQYNGWLDQQVHQWTVVSEVSDYVPQKGLKWTRYCVTVDHPTHRFFTLGGLVANCIDNDATLRCFLGIKGDLQAKGKWEGFYRHCVQTLPILIYMGTKGILVDRAAQVQFADKLESGFLEATRNLQAKVPAEIKPKKVWKKPPADLLPALFETTAPCPKCAEDIVLTDGKPCKKCKGEGIIKVYEQTLDFNPDSPPQVKRLMTHLGITIPKKKGKETTDGKTLDRLAKRFPVFKDIKETRKWADMKGTFIYPLGSDDRIRTIFTFNPSTWRKSSKKKGAIYLNGRWEPSSQLQNMPNPKKGEELSKELAEELRRSCVAAPGHTLIEADSSAIEAVLVGLWAGDPDYIRLAKLGIHDFMTSHVVGEPASVSWSDEKLGAFLRDIKKRYKGNVREGNKQVVHLSNYLGTPKKMRELHPALFPTDRAAKEKQDFYFDLFPSIRKWHQSTLERVHKEHYLDNHFGYRHYFWHVLKKNFETGLWELGDDARRVIASGPQSDASACQTEYILMLVEIAAQEAGISFEEAIELFTESFWSGSLGVLEGTIVSWLRLIVHDSLILEVPNERLDYACSMVYKVMTSPIPQLGGLSIGAEVQVGESLGDMTEWHPRKETFDGVFAGVQIKAGHHQELRV